MPTIFTASRKVIVAFSILVFHLFFLNVSLAQKQQQWSSGEILHAMKKLNVVGSVLYMAAHPDDENTRLLAYMARTRQYRTGYMAMTRGDGGQNLIGNQQGFELGLIRTQELLAARRVDGAEQFFSRAFDFGFSKRTEEALSFWEKEKILSDAVWVIRNFRPDIILTRFPEDSRAGHGHHSGSAVIAREAFIAAADPSRFPEQLKYGVTPWKAKRIMWNTSNFFGNNTTAENQMKLDVGDYLPLLGKSIGEISSESRSQHRSQGFGSAAARGVAIEYFSHTLGDKADKDPMDGIDCSWNRLEGGAAISSMVDKLISSYDVNRPSASVSQLMEIRKALGSIKDEYWKKLKSAEVEKLIRMVMGIHLEAINDKQFVKQGDSLKVNLTINNRSSISATVSNFSIEGMEMSPGATLSNNVNWNQLITLPIAKDRAVSQPYWLANPMNKGSFNVSDQQLIGMAENKPTLQVKVKLKMSGEDMDVLVPVMYRNVDPAIGEFLHPVYVIPSQVTTTPLKPLLVNTNSKVNSSNASNTGSDIPFMHVISYEHIPTLVYFSKNDQMVVKVDLKTTGKRIGYIVGAGDKVPAAIEMMGYELIELNKNDITADRLKSLDAVVVGVRAYNVNDWMDEKYDVLMEYVRNGGNMVVQYNTNSFAGPLSKLKIGPKPFTVSRGRITEEDCEIKFLDEKDPVLNYPNKITSEDFKGWVQERGIYFADAFSPDYRALFSMHDQNEADQTGSLIVRNEGKGRFIYTGLVFYRELPAGVPGAFRLFANLISNPNLKVNEVK
ncbi:MAG: PIG-L family deacetylase [Chitinophagia bacterium]|nr:PIG-L family deacetylase [Chitinophagia bacterium]